MLLQIGNPNRATGEYVDYGLWDCGESLIPLSKNVSPLQ